mmetsp:Transcript_2242/g.6605  ORF Transcript_2242/g.6605 Transcript_2242/m.6605 type:complete len:321 (-) Transcript_2242:77-1039(-)
MLRGPLHVGEPGRRRDEEEEPEQREARCLQLEGEGVGQAVRGAEASGGGPDAVADAGGEGAHPDPHRLLSRRRHAHRPDGGPDALQRLRGAHEELRGVHRALGAQAPEDGRAEGVQREAEDQEELGVAELQRPPPEHGGRRHADLVHGAEEAELRRRPRVVHLVLDGVQAGGGGTAVVGHEHLHPLAEQGEDQDPRLQRGDRAGGVRRLRAADAVLPDGGRRDVDDDGDVLPLQGRARARRVWARLLQAQVAQAGRSVAGGKGYAAAAGLALAVLLGEEAIRSARDLRVSSRQGGVAVMQLVMQCRALERGWLRARRHVI